MRKIKTKPFDLEKALNGAPVVTRNGREVKIIDYDPQQVFCVLFQVEGSLNTFTVDSKGNYISSFLKYPLDLFLLDEETQEGGEK